MQTFEIENKSIGFSPNSFSLTATKPNLLRLDNTRALDEHERSFYLLVPQFLLYLQNFQ